MLSTLEYKQGEFNMKEPYIGIYLKWIFYKVKIQELNTFMIYLHHVPSTQKSSMTKLYIYRALHKAKQIEPIKCGDKNSECET